MIKLNKQLFWRLGRAQGQVAAISQSSLHLTVYGDELLAPQVGTLFISEHHNGEPASTRDKGCFLQLNGHIGAVGPGWGSFEVSLQQDAMVLDEFLGKLRKQQHIDLCRDGDVETEEKNFGFAELNFIPQAVPELDWCDLSIETTFLGRTFTAPLLISGMTGGVAQGEEINRRLAGAAVRLGIPMGVGSQRIACEHPQHTAIFAMKKQYPELFLLGNLGCAQIISPHGVDLARQAVEMIDANALVVHLNVVQECLQVEGDKNFKGLLARLETLVRTLDVPVVVKEVGCGISVETAERLLATGIAALDIAGKGGTSWGYIEGLRSNDPSHVNLATGFRNWGIPTAYSLAAIRRKFPHAVLVASGGVRDGLTVAKALGLGASMVGLALPLFQAALISEDAVVEVLQKVVEGLKITMMATGSRRSEELHKALCYGQPLRQEFIAFINSKERSARTEV